MAVEAFLKLDGVTGESQKAGHVGEIELFSFSWGASNPSSVSFGTGSGAGKVDISSLSLQTQVAKQSTTLFQFCASGQHIANGVLAVREAGGGEAPKEYLKYTMNEVFVDSVSWGGAAGGGKPSESISLSFKKIKIEYSAQKEDGSLESPVFASWDVAKNTK
ncbi:MAG TPA: type VI secretion system tube protein Hcp [Bryobacteraceae bacterium]|nr:type VI secretion system tube protein Hcp [Bryobacteraceae bacterium]